MSRWQVKMDDTDEKVRRGGLMVVKADSQTGQPAAQGGATLAGATFFVTNKSDKAVEVHLDGKKDDSQNKVTVEDGQLIEDLVLTTDENGVATTDKDGDGVDYTLPYGTYELAETSAPQGHLKTDEKITVTVHPEETSEKGDGYVFGSKVSWTADGGWNTHKNYSDVAKWSIDASKLDDEAGVWFGMNLNTSIMSSTAIVEGVSRCPNCQDSSA